MAYRGLYGQKEGNEDRRQSDWLAERLEENDRIEGEHVAALHRMFKEKDWTNLKRKTDALVKAGFKQARIDSMLTRAQHGVRL
jgi:hypothetical protein